MNELDAKSLRGKTLRWTFTEGPTKGSAFDHVFGADGSVTFTSVEGPNKGKASRVDRYEALQAAKGVVAVSYLSKNGYTLTIVMNSADQTLVGFASNDKEWYPVRGTFEEIGASAAKAR